MVDISKECDMNLLCEQYSFMLCEQYSFMLWEQCSFMLWEQYSFMNSSWITSRLKCFDAFCMMERWNQLAVYMTTESVRVKSLL